MVFFKRSSRDQVPRRRTLERRDTEVPAASGQRNFLRNRTLSGVQPTVEEPSERSRAHQLASQRRRVGFVFILILAVMALMVLFLLQFTSRVTIAFSQPVERQVDVSAYTDTLNDYFSNHPVERLRFSLSEGQLHEFVIARHPEIASVRQVTVWGMGQTQFTIALRKPVAGWEIGDKQYYVDEDGVAFDTNYFKKPTVQIIDRSGVTLEQGTAVTSTRFLGLIGKIVSLAESRGYNVTQAILPLGTTRQVDIKIASTKPYVKLSIDRGAGEQVEDMDRVLQYLASKRISPTYVDVRVESRAYYK